MPSLEQRLSEQAPNPSGIHEAMARHAEDIFDEFQGILPIFLGKRTQGPFLTLAIPKQISQSREILLSSLTDLIAAYELSLVSFVSAIQSRAAPEENPKLGAILITADNASSLYQLPWQLEFDSEANLASHTRSETETDIISLDTWRTFFEQSPGPAEKQTAYNNLLLTFGDSSAIPEFSV
ncbi:MAG TPA: hypothetical protein DIV79_11105 [Opitutae bacterium]|nr:hypothetical protein [Opitutaceae bacterium]HCR30554.1 hypothetical protein [Opitutae bacterium]